MTMLKSLLLGTAAGLVAMTGAQAADLPVKAKAVQYVKICSLYGAGFYYIPGTDTCIKVGGWVRSQTGSGYNGSMTNGPMVGNVNNRSTTDLSTRNRGYITADARSQTEYGTLRSYIAVGLNGDNATSTLNATASAFSSNRAFIQLGGLTAGRASSFYDFMTYSAVSYNGGSVWTPAGTDTGDGGQHVLAYTVQLGGGLSATISAEEQSAKTAAVGQYATAGTLTTASATSGDRGIKAPDFVGNIRLEQAWGSAQIMAVAHDASANYYTSTGATHPSDIWGYALGTGLKINLPMLGKGDYFEVQYNWTKGAIKYATAGTSLLKTSGGTSGYGTMSDGVYGLTGDIELTTAWSLGAAYQHNWDPKMKTSLYGGYSAVQYTTAANALMCTAALLLTGCDQDFSTWQVGSRTEWAPVSNLAVGIDVLYTKLVSANSGTTTTSDNQQAWVGQLRIQRNFFP